MYMMDGARILGQLLAVALPVVITVSFNSGAPHYIAYHPDAEPVEMCDWLSGCASPAWIDGNTLRCTWRNATSNAGENHTETEDDPLPLPGNNGSDVPPACPTFNSTFGGPDTLRVVGGLIYPFPAAASVYYLITSWFKDIPPCAHFFRTLSFTFASLSCFVLMIIYAARPVIGGPGWDVAIQSPGTWVAVRTYFALSTLLGVDLEESGQAAGLETCLLIPLLFLFFMGPFLCLTVSTLSSPLAAAHRILSTGEWAFALCSAGLHLMWPVLHRLSACRAHTTRGVLLLGPASFAAMTALYFGTTPTHTPLTSFWLPLGDPGDFGFWSVATHTFMPLTLAIYMLEDMATPPRGAHTAELQITGEVPDALEMEAASSSSEAECGSCGEDSDDEDELEEVGDEGAGGCVPADSNSPDGMLLSLRLPTGDIVAICVADSASLGGLRRQALREMLSAASGVPDDSTGDTARRVALSSGGVRLRGPAHTPLHTLPLENGCVVEVCVKAAPQPVSESELSEMQSDLLLAVRNGDAGLAGQLLRSHSRHPGMFHNSRGRFAEEYARILPEAPSDVLHALLRWARPTEACSVLLAVKDTPRFLALSHRSGVLRRSAVMACVGRTAQPWVLYRLQQCTRRDLGFGVSLEEAVVAYVRHSLPDVSHRKVCATLQAWGMGVRSVPPAARSILVAEEPPLWVPCMTYSSHPFSSVLLAEGVPLREVPHAVAALRVVCAYSVVCVLCVVGVAYVHATFQMVDDNSAWMTVVFVAVSGPFFLFDLQPEWVQCLLIRHTKSRFHRDTHQTPDDYGTEL